MARKPKSLASDSVPVPELKNARPYDLLAQEVDEFFEQANDWLKDGKAVTLPQEADALGNVITGLRDLDKRIEIERKIEAKPFDDGKAEVQSRYKGLTSKTGLAIAGILKTLTVWRNKLAEEQRAEAERVRIAAEKASETAQHVAEVAGNDIGAQHIAADAEDTARRLTKTADRMEKNAGTGLRMRTVWDIDFIDGENGIKLAIAHYYRTEHDLMVEFLTERIRSDIKAGQRNTPGVIYTDRKEAY